VSVFHCLVWVMTGCDDWLVFILASVLARKIFKYPNAVFGMKLLAEAFLVLRSKLFVL
jgi:hypothetical protein